MDWADDVAYSVHDLEDGIVAGLVRPGRPGRPRRGRRRCASWRPSVYCDETPRDLEEVVARPAGAAGLAALVRRHGRRAGPAQGHHQHAHRPVLLGRAEPRPRRPHGDAPLRRYDADLLVPRRTRAECALLKAVAARWVMARPGVARPRRSASGRSSPSSSCSSPTGRPQALEPSYAQAWRAAADDRARLRVVVDQVASLTDAAAVALHARALRNVGRDGRPRVLDCARAAPEARSVEIWSLPWLGASATRTSSSCASGHRSPTSSGESVQLRPAGGGRLKGLCPFHDEKTPSFNVNPTLGYYMCFGCGESGDVISFVRGTEHLSFVETVERLAQRYGVTLTYEQGSAAAGRQSVPAHPAGRGPPPGAGLVRRAARLAGGRRGPAVPRRARLRPGRGHDLRRRLRAAGLGPPGQAPARARASPARSWCSAGWPPRAVAGRSTGSAAGCCGRSATSPATSSASAPASSTTTTTARSTSTPPRRRSTRRARCSTASTSPRRRSPGGGRRWSSRATPTSWPATSRASPRRSRPAARRSAPTTSA